MGKLSTLKSELICTKCGSINTIFRKTGKQRKKFHIKDSYCYKCKEITKQIEAKDSDILKKQLEFKLKLTKEEKMIYNLLIKREIASNMVSYLSGLENIPNDISRGYVKKKSLYKKRK